MVIRVLPSVLEFIGQVFCFKLPEQITSNTEDVTSFFSLFSNVLIATVTSDPVSGFHQPAPFSS